MEDMDCSWKLSQASSKTRTHPSLGAFLDRCSTIMERSHGQKKKAIEVVVLLL
jgi:hypothetical protein